MIRIFIAAWCCFAFSSAQALAYDLSPEGTQVEKAIAKRYYNWWQRVVAGLSQQGLPHFKVPVHEEITHRIFGCNGDPDACGNPDAGFASAYVIAGVRWNDDPPFRLEHDEAGGTSCKVTETIRFTTQPTCWAQLFFDAKSKAAAGMPIDAKSRMSLLARSHFGDLQFIHAMASKEGEPASITKARIMMWSEFTWRVALGDIPLAARLREVKIEGFAEFFGNTGWTVQDLFSLGNPALRRYIDQVALGSMLHMIEDSFAAAHTDRGEAQQGERCRTAPEHAAPGTVRSFNSYANQDAAKHAEYDSRAAFANHWTVHKPNVLDAGQAVLALYERRAGWEEARAYLECVFAIDDPGAPASAGIGFRK